MILPIQIVTENIIPFVNKEDKLVLRGGKQIGKAAKRGAFQLRIKRFNIVFDRSFDQRCIIAVRTTVIGKAVHIQVNDVVLIQMNRITFAMADLELIEDGR